MSRKEINLNGVETDAIKVLRRATPEETPSWNRTDVYWIVECKGCEKRRAQRASRVGKQLCRHCHVKRLLSYREDKVRAQALNAWDRLTTAVNELNLDAIEKEVKLLRRYETITFRASDVEA